MLFNKDDHNFIANRKFIMKILISNSLVKITKYYINNNSSLSKTCAIFNCSNRSLKRWIDRFNETGNVDNKNRKEGSYKIRQRHVKFILTTTAIKTS